MEHEKAYIYGLIDPREQQIYYVGHTVNMNQRLNGHKNDKSETAKTEWIADLANNGLEPIMVELACVDYVDRFVQEYKMIYLGRALGWPLTNTSAMKTEKYTSIFDGLEQTLIVEVEKGLTWRWVNQQIVNDDSWRNTNLTLLQLSTIGFTIALFLFDFALFGGFEDLTRIATTIVLVAFVVFLLLCGCHFYRFAVNVSDGAYHCARK